MKLLFTISLFSTLFLTYPVARSFNLENLQFLPLIILFIFSLTHIFGKRSSQFLTYNKPELQIILFGFIFVLIKLVLGQTDQVFQVFLFIFLPIVLFLFLRHIPKSYIQISKNLILLFFIIECLIAILERFYFTYFFPYLTKEELLLTQIEGEGLFFRSTALLGHPLNNALIVSTILAFILISEFKNKLKLFCLTIGNLALLSFNARSAILIWLVISTWFFISEIKKLQNGSLKLFIYVFYISISAVAVFYLIISFGFGGRLFALDILSSGVYTRTNILEFTKCLTEQDLIFGNTHLYSEIIEKTGEAGIENSYFVIILNYGVLFFIIFFSLYFKWIKNNLSIFSLKNKFFIFLGFIVLGSTNNGLAPFYPWIIFAICLAIFSIPTKNLKLIE